MLIYRCKSLDWLNQVNSKQWASWLNQEFHFLIELKYIIKYIVHSYSSLGQVLCVFSVVI